MTRIFPRHRRPRAVVAGLAALAFAVAAAPAAEAAKAPAAGDVRVMTRNLYLGADLTPALVASNTTQLAIAAGNIQQVVDQTDFHRRSKLLAAEIKDANPDLVGLQEVALWRNDFEAPSQDGPQTPAKTERYDFLDTLMADVNRGRRGPDYRVVRVQREADIEAPLSSGGDGRLTMRDVILARKGKAVQTEHDHSQRFKNNLSQVVGGALPVTFWRGWLSVEATVRGEEFRFVNTHLEAFHPTIRNQQAGELIDTLPNEIGPANAVQGAGKPVVLVGDLNSDDDLTELGEGSAADEQAYSTLTTDPDGGGPRIPLDERSPDRPGTSNDTFSCCYHNQTIDDPADFFDHVVDHIMVSDDDPGGNPESPTDGNANDISLVGSHVTGENIGGADNTSDMTAPPRLWPSDHGGVVSTLRFP